MKDMNDMRIRQERHESIERSRRLELTTKVVPSGRLPQDTSATAVDARIAADNPCLACVKLASTHEAL